MTDILEKIIADKRKHVSQRMAEQSFAELDHIALGLPKPRPFMKSLQSRIMANDVGLITEIKKASPSAGIIRSNFSPATLARAYEDGGAACLSVLTDTPYFQGTNDHLIEARQASTLPILRKDFMIDAWQVAETRAMGADCILVIMAAVTNDTARDLHNTAVGYGMDVLLEVHNRIELERALMIPSGMIGINNRNLKTLKVDISNTEDLINLIPPDRLVVSESGLATAEDLARLQKIGVHSFLVGESLLTQEDVTSATLQLRFG